eukprot:1764721-Pleurochrysis_carterae.AAC.3
MQEASSLVVNKTFIPPPPRRVKKMQVSGQSSTNSSQNSSSSRGGGSWVKSDIATPGGGHTKHTSKRSGKSLLLPITPDGVSPGTRSQKSKELYQRKGRGVQKRVGRPCTWEEVNFSVQDEYVEKNMVTGALNIVQASPGGRFRSKKRILQGRQILKRKSRQKKGQQVAGRLEQTNTDAEKQESGRLPYVQEKINAPKKSSEATQNNKVRIALWAAAGESNSARAERVRASIRKRDVRLENTKAKDYEMKQESAKVAMVQAQRSGRLEEWGPPLPSLGEHHECISLAEKEAARLQEHFDVLASLPSRVHVCSSCEEIGVDHGV